MKYFLSNHSIAVRIEDQLLTTHQSSTVLYTNDMSIIQKTEVAGNMFLDKNHNTNRVKIQLQKQKDLITIWFDKLEN